MSHPTPLASLVKAGTVGDTHFISQRRYEQYPLTNCTGFALAMCLEYAGLSIPDPAEFIRRGRIVTGVAEVGPHGSQGTSVGDWQKAIAAIAPWVVIDAGWVHEADFLAGLGGHAYSAAIGVHYPALTTHLRRFSKAFQGDHRGTLWSARRHGGRWQVLWVDPVATQNGKPAGFDYPGEWVDWSDIKAAMASSAGGHTSQVSGNLVWAATIDRETGLRTNILLERALAPGSTAAVPKGSDTFALDSHTGRLAAGKPSGTVTVPVGASVIVTQYPDDSPSGRMLQVTGGALDGSFVRASQVKLMEPVATDCAAQVDAATRPLVAEVAARDAYIAQVRAIPVPT